MNWRAVTETRPVRNTSQRDPSSTNKGIDRAILGHRAEVTYHRVSWEQIFGRLTFHMIAPRNLSPRWNPSFFLTILLRFAPAGQNTCGGLYLLCLGHLSLGHLSCVLCLGQLICLGRPPCLSHLTMPMSAIVPPMPIYHVWASYHAW